MKRATQSVDRLLYKMGQGIATHKYKVLIAMIILLMGMISNVPHITLDTSTEGFLHKEDPVRLTYDKFQNQFGHDEKIVIAIKSDGIFKEENLLKLKNLHYELQEKVPYINDITSLINARNTLGNDDSLIVEDLLEELPKDDLARQDKKQLAMANPMYKDLLLNSDGTFSVIVIEPNTYTSAGASESADALSEFDDFEESDTIDEPQEFISDAEINEMLDVIHQITARYKTENFEIDIAGSPNVTGTLKASMKNDIKKFNGLIILSIIILLALLFRRLSGVIFPLLAVILSVLGTVGLMAFFGTPIKTITQILPSFILAVGVGTSIHIMAIFYHHYDKYGDKIESIAYTLRHSGLAIIMTSLTTAVGIGSFAFSSVAPVSDLGIYGAAGVMIALFVSMILIPALLAILPMKRKAYKSVEHKDFFERLLERIAHFTQMYPKAITLSSLTLMAISIGLATQLSYSHNPLTWLPKTNEARVATEKIDQEMRGTISLELIIDTKKENGLYNYELLKSLEEIQTYAQKISTDDYFVGKVISIVDVMKEIHRALNENRDEYYAIPKDPKLIAQEILLFENSGSDDLEDFVDSQFSKARMTFKMPWVDSVKYHGLLEELEEHLEKTLPKDVEVELTGMIPLLSDTITKAIISAGQSYVIAIVAISFMMILLLSSIKLGIISMIPNLFPVFFAIAIMVIFGMPFDLFTMLVGTIVLGLAVDDNVHFMHNFVRFKDEGKTTEEAVRLTLTGSGRAMLITSIVLSIGFFAYLFSSMANLFNFGLLAGASIIVALLADFIIAPALMALLYKDQNSIN